MPGFAAARRAITGRSWPDDVARASLPAAERKFDCEPESEPVSSLPVIRRYVVLIHEPGPGRIPHDLTNSGVMDLETAEHEAAVWRKREREQGSGRRFEVCPVLGAMT